MKQKTAVIDNVLLDYGVDLTQKARDGKLDVVWGRDAEINRASQVLNRRKKNNLLLVGLPGVGKTSIAEGLALRIVSKDISWNLQNKTVFSLDITSVMAGTQFRGQMEKRMKQIIDYLKENRDIILFIDEIHSIIDSTSSSSGMSVSNILKPALSSGAIQCIGATTIEEARKHFDKDAALSRRFQKLVIDPSSISDTIKILQSCKASYEEYHNVTYPDVLLQKLPEWASHYIADRFLPDSAIDLMDEAGSKAQLDYVKIPPRVLKMETVIESLREQKHKLIKEEMWAQLPVVKHELDRLTDDVALEYAQIRAARTSSRKEIQEKDVLEILSSLSKVPLDKLSENGKSKIDELINALDTRIIGQQPAKEKVIRGLKRSVVGLHNKRKPVLTALLLGSTGSGKTAMAKVIAETWYNGEMIRLDMSEYMEKISSTQFVGAPPGYVGHDNGGKLTEAVRRKPYSLILLDEIEKAHPDVLNYLLQVFDDGHLTDGQGNSVDFTNTMILMTSNLGCKEAAASKGLGFGAKKSAIQEKGIESAKKFFSPELWNRIDEQVVFESLTPAHIERIVEIEINRVKGLLLERGIKLRVHKKVKEHLAKTGYSEDYGARFLERTVRSLLIDQLTDFVLDNNTKDATIAVNLDKNDEVVLKIA